MEDDTTSDLCRRVSRYSVRYDRIAHAVRRVAARAQEHRSDSRQSRSASVRQIAFAAVLLRLCTWNDLFSSAAKWIPIVPILP